MSGEWRQWWAVCHSVFPLPGMRRFGYRAFVYMLQFWSTHIVGGGILTTQFLQTSPHGGLVFCSFLQCPSHIPVCETQQVTNYPHNLQHYAKYLRLYVFFHTIPTIQKKSKHLRLVPLDILTDSDNLEGYSKVIPGQVKDSEELT